MNPPASARYDGLSLSLHWITAVLVMVAFVLGPEGFGRLMRQGVDPATHADIVWHESLGVAVFVLTVLRLGWTAVRPTAPRFPTAPALLLLAKSVHVVLWALLLALPATALLTLGSENHPLTLLGGLRVEHLPLIAGSAAASLADWGEVHKWLGDLIMVLAGVHAAAALFHHWVLGDGLLRAMLPATGRRH